MSTSEQSLFRKYEKTNNTYAFYRNDQNTRTIIPVMSPSKQTKTQQTNIQDLVTHLINQQPVKKPIKQSGHGMKMKKSKIRVISYERQVFLLGEQNVQGGQFYCQQ